MKTLAGSLFIFDVINCSNTMNAAMPYTSFIKFKSFLSTELLTCSPTSQQFKEGETDEPIPKGLLGGNGS